MDRYRNNYNNSSHNEYSGGTWVYMNGELYHAGVKGMHWYQHLPGTDWWKTLKTNYQNRMTPQTGYQYVDGAMVPRSSKPSKAKAGWNALKDTVKTAGRTYGTYLKGEAQYYGNKVKNSKFGKGVSKFWNTSKGFTSQQIAKLSEFARNAWSSVRTSATNFLQKGGDIKNYINDKINSDSVNLWFENAKLGIAAGVNKFLDDIGMKKETDNFISKKSNVSLSSLTRTSSPSNGQSKVITKPRTINLDINSPENRQKRRTTIIR